MADYRAPSQVNQTAYYEGAGANNQSNISSSNILAGHVRQNSQMYHRANNTVANISPNQIITTDTTLMMSNVI